MNKEQKKPYLVIRDDGFSPFYAPDNPFPLEKEKFLKDNVDYMTHYPAIRVKEYGVGPGSVFTFPTKVGELLDERRVTECELDEYRKLTAQRVRDLAERGEDVMSWVSERCHELGIEMWVRFELNHEYGPASDKNWTWAFYTGSLNREHPEYRIPGCVNLHFKHPEVRHFKVEILREVVQHNIEGVSLDFCVYPPFVENPETEGWIMALSLQGRSLSSEKEVVISARYLTSRLTAIWKSLRNPMRLARTKCRLIWECTSFLCDCFC